MIFGFTQTLQTLLFGSLVGIAGVMATLLPTVLEWDEHLGLSALFYLRGEIDAPQEALVVAMDRANGRHSTVQLKHDKTGWMYNGNYRSSSDTGTYRWEGFKSAR